MVPESALWFLSLPCGLVLESGLQLGSWFFNSSYFSIGLLGIALARMAKASNATPGRCTAPLNSTVRSRKDDLPSEVTELGSVVN